MPAEPRLALVLLAASALVRADDAPPPAPDPALLEFLAEFSVDERFVDPIALDATKHSILDRKERAAAAAARRAQANQDAQPEEAAQEKTR